MMKNIFLCLLLVCAGELSAAVDAAVTVTNADGTYVKDDILYFTVTFTGPVDVTKDVSRLKLELNRLDDSAYAKATADGAGVSSATFSYQIRAGDFTTDLNHAGNGALSNIAGYGGTITNGNLGYLHDIKVDTPLTVTVTASPASGTKKFGDQVSIKVNFNRKITVGGTLAPPSLQLALSGSSRSIAGALDATKAFIAFDYTVADNEESADLDYFDRSAFTFSEATIDGLSSITLPDPGTTGSLGSSANLIIDGKKPTFSITGPSAPQKSAPIAFNIASSENVVGFASSDITTTPNNGTVTLTGSGSNYTAQVTPKSSLTAQNALNSGKGTASTPIEVDQATAVSLNLTNGDPIIIGSNLYFITIDKTSDPSLIFVTNTLNSPGLLANVAIGASIFPPAGTSFSISLNNSVANDNAGNTSVAQTGSAVVYDPVPPIVKTLTIASDKKTFTATFSETVATALTPAGLTVTNGTATVDGSANPVFVISVTPTDIFSPVKLKINANAVTDEAGNGNRASDEVTATAINTLSVKTVTGTNGFYKAGSTVDIKVNLSASVTVGGSGAKLKLALTNASHTAINRDAVLVAPTTNPTAELIFRYTVQPGDNATDLEYAADSPFDQGLLTFNGRNDLSLVSGFPAAGTVGESLAKTSDIVIDTTAPTFTWQNPLPDPFRSNTIGIDVTCSENPKQTDNLLTIEDVTVTNGTIAINSSAKPKYTFTVTPQSPFVLTSTANVGFKTIAVKALSGSISLPANSPISLGLASGSPQFVTSAAVTITTSPTVVGLTDRVEATIAANTPVVVNNGLPITLQIKAGAIYDDALNDSVASNLITLSYDILKPSCVITPPAASSTSDGKTFEFSVEFNEPMATETETPLLKLKDTDFSPVNADIIEVKNLNKQTWTVKVVAKDEKQNVSLTLGAGKWKDVAGNENLASNTAVVTPNAAAPTVAIVAPDNTDFPMVFKVTTTKALLGLATDDFSLADSNGTIDSPIQSPLSGLISPYLVTVRPTSTLKLAAGAVATDQRLTIKTTAPLTLSKGMPLRIGTQTVLVDEDTPLYPATDPGDIVPIRQPLTVGLPLGSPAWKPDGESLKLKLRANAAQDVNGANTTATDLATFYDPLPPTVILTTAGGGLTTSGISFEVTFSEDVTDVTSSSFTVTGGSIIGVNEVDKKYYVVCSAPGPTVTLAINKGGAKDRAGNVTAENAVLFKYPEDSETLGITLSTPTASRNTAPIPIDVKVTRAVTGLTLSDFTITNGTALRLDNKGTDYQLQVNPTPNITVSQAAAAGVTFIRCVAKTPVTLPAKAAISIGSRTYQISDKSVEIGTSASTVDLASGIIDSIAVDAPVWTATGQLITVDLPAGTCQDSAGNSNEDIDVATCTYDPTLPILTVTPPAALDSNGKVIFTITPNEPVTGLSINTMIIGNGSSPMISGPDSNSVYTVSVTPAGRGPVDLSLRANAVTDSAGNSNLAVAKVSFENLASIETVTSNTPNGTYGGGTTLLIKLHFSEIVTVSGTPTLTLNFGPNKKAVYSSGSGTQDLLFAYTVVDGDAVSKLDYAAANSLSLPAGASIKDALDNSANLSLAAPGATGSLAANASIAINTSKPTDPGKPIPDGVSSGGGCGAGSGIGVLLGCGSLLLIAGRRRQAA